MSTINEIAEATTGEIAIKRNIFSLDAEIDQIAEAFEVLEDQADVPDEVANQVLEYFDALMDERDRKADRYADFIAARSARAENLKAEAARLLALAQVEENKAKSAKTLLHLFMDFKGMSKWETPLHKFSVCKNGGKIPLQIDANVDPEKVAGRFQKVVVTLDTDAVRSDLEAGLVIPFAKLGERGSHLRIR
jgi:Gp157 protein